VQPFPGDFRVLEVEQRIGFVAEHGGNRCHRFRESVSVQFERDGLDAALMAIASSRSQKAYQPMMDWPQPILPFSGHLLFGSMDTEEQAPP
jgi:hypothetical protein